jgi:lipid-binding SYLF domain-containing protein
MASKGKSICAWPSQSMGLRRTGNCATIIFMKVMMLGLMLLGFAGTALGIDKVELDNRIRSLNARFQAMQQKPDKSIPAELLKKAQGIILLDRTKAGFLFAFQGGAGVAMARDAKTQKWSPPAFLAANEASLGAQIGGERALFVILLMTTNATRLLTEPTFDLAGEARGTAGAETRGVEGKVSSNEQPVLIFDDRQGLYGGAAVKAGAITPDEEDNRVYYQQVVSMKDILFDKKVKSTPTASELADKINELSRTPKK